jgi:hypothetical protein
MLIQFPYNQLHEVQVGGDQTYNPNQIRESVTFYLKGIEHGIFSKDKILLGGITLRRISVPGAGMIYAPSIVNQKAASSFVAPSEDLVFRYYLGNNSETVESALSDFATGNTDAIKIEFQLGTWVKVWKTKGGYGLTYKGLPSFLDWCQIEAQWNRDQ